MSINREFIDDFEKMIKKYRARLDKVLDQTQEKLEDNTGFKDQVQALERLLRDADQLFNHLKDATEETWAELYDKSVSVLQSLKNAFYELLKKANVNSIDKLKNDAYDLGQENLEKFEQYAQEKPMTVALAALGVGFLVGFLTRGGCK